MEHELNSEDEFPEEFTMTRESSQFYLNESGKSLIAFNSATTIKAKKKARKLLVEQASRLTNELKAVVKMMGKYEE